MTDTQKLIDQMHAGDISVIVDNIQDKTPILVLNAIMAGVKIKLKDKAFIDGLKKAEENEVALLGLPIQKVATAALHLLGQRKYNGKDSVIISLIESGLR